MIKPRVGDENSAHPETFLPTLPCMSWCGFQFRADSADGLGSLRVVYGGTDCNDSTTDFSGLDEMPSTGGNVLYQALVV